jgi:energy-coupling factor transport system substrate-specific component
MTPSATIAVWAHKESTMENARRVDSSNDGAKSPMAWKTRDIIVAAAVAVPLGLVWSLVWGQLWLVARGILPELGFFVAGFYVAAGVIVGYIVRRPGAALLGEMLGALIEVPLTPFGAAALVLGLLQGLGTEAVFAATRYRNWSLPVVMAAGALGAGLAFMTYEYVVFTYGSFAIEILALRLLSRVAGGALLGGLCSKLIADALARTGVLNNFPIARNRVVEV